MTIRSLLILNLFIHLCLAYILPLSNDEAYYWDWGQALHLSYKDHPPGISWLTYLSDSLGFGLWRVRLLSPFLHTVGLYFAFKTLHLAIGPSSNQKRSGRNKTLFYLILSSPGLCLIGSVSIPDIGLIAAMQALCYFLILWSDRPKLTLVNAVILGLLLGISGLFKYHALPLAFGLLLGFLWVRWQFFKQDLWFYITSALLGFFTCTPVWLWNMAHDWASFRYQAAHGFSAGSWSLVLPLQAMVAISALIGPAIVWLIAMYRRAVEERHLSVAEKIVIPAFSILIGLILVAALRKPVLPHWTMPAFALALPVVVARVSSSYLGRVLKFQMIYASVVGVIILALAISFAAPQRWLSFFNGDPKFLSELTVWDPMALEIDQQLKNYEDEMDLDCKGPLFLAAPRWYAVSQLQYRLKLSPSVLLLSDDPNDYYSLRDKDLWPKVCKVAVILGPKQSLPSSFLEVFTIRDEKKLMIKYHEALNWRIVVADKKATSVPR